MKKYNLLLGLSLILPCLASCKGKALTVTFKQDGASDVVIEFNENTLQSEIEIKEPDLVKKDGYTVVWEDYSIKDKTESFVVNAKYTPITYYADFKAQGILVESVPFTVSDVTGENSKLPADRTPEVPSHPWSNPYWEDYSLELNNIVVNAKYDVLKEFKVSFIADGDELCDPITITCQDLDSENKIKDNLIPDAVKNYKSENFDVAWDFTVNTAADTMIIANLYLHPYYIKFLDFEGNQYGDLVPYTVENKTWASVNKPAAPELEGYNTFWNAATLTYSDDELVIATPNKDGKEYKVAFAGYDGTQTVKFGEEYYLNNKSTALTKWFDEEGNLIENQGIWKFPSNKDLSLRAITEDNFDTELVPTFFNKNESLNISKIEMAVGQGINESNAVKVTVATSSDFGVKLDNTYLSQIFADSSVKALTMVVSASRHNNNFRHRTGAANVCYELNDSKFGLETYYKKFSFTREMYQNHLETGDFVIYGGSDGNSVAGFEFYINSFIFNEDDVLKELDTKLSFECGSATLATATKVEAYTPFLKNGSLAYNKLSIEYGSSIQLDNVGHTSEKVTDGLSSFTFRKVTSGYIAFYLGQEFTAKIEASASKKIAFDIYSTVYINTNGSVNNATDGKNNSFKDQGGKIPANEWTTFVLEMDKNITASSDRGRFLIIQGSTAGTYYIDNIRILSGE